MTVIPKITSTCECETPGWRLVKQYCPRPDEIQRVEASQGGRVVEVNAHALKLLLAAGVTPPDRPGDLIDVHELDLKLQGSNLSTIEKMALKGHLRDVGLLVPGTYPNLSRR